MGDYITRPARRQRDFCNLWRGRLARIKPAGEPPALQARFFLRAIPGYNRHL
ncbi:MAG: hypothetical protein HZC40_25210 [Chloroflexi bacterium]|nr:hypothetical protein [Chloroflexota bacterium]